MYPHQKALARGRVLEQAPCRYAGKSPSSDQKWDSTGDCAFQLPWVLRLASRARSFLVPSRGRKLDGCGGKGDGSVPLDGGSQQGETFHCITDGRASGHTGAPTAIWGSCGDCSHPTPSQAAPGLAGRWAFSVTREYCV